MKRSVLVVVAAGFIGIGTNGWAQPSRQNDTSIQKVEIFPPGQQGVGPPVTVMFTGHLYAKEASSATTSEEKFLISVVEANRTGNVDDVLRVWDESEHANIKRMATDEKLWSGNRTYYQKVTETKFVARVHYGQFLIFVVNHVFADGTESVKSYPLKRLGNRLVLTNELSRDPVFAYLISSYVQTLNKRR